MSPPNWIKQPPARLPIVSNRTFTLRTDWEILEYSCEENNVGLVEGRIKVPNNAK